MTWQQRQLRKQEGKCQSQVTIWAPGLFISCNTGSNWVEWASESKVSCSYRGTSQITASCYKRPCPCDCEEHNT
ncbi:hypothetical protein M758_3G177300 [Ceratodon purpureus]|nr:hypothetical protein M758_3G177300 [Ceratodon purpureus]